MIEHWLDPQTVREGFADLNAYWDNMLSVLVADTPDTDSNRMVSIWNAYQCLVTFNLSRSVSSYETGISRGMGFRDSCQDLLGCRATRPGTLQGAHPRHRRDPVRQRRRVPPVPAAYQDGQRRDRSGFNDDPLWLVLGCRRLPQGNRRRHDPRRARQVQRRRRGHPLRPPERSVQYTLDRIGPHGLPLIGRADWNDCLNLNCFSETPGESFQTTENQSGGVAESVFIAGLFTLAARELAGIAALTGRTAEAEAYRADAEKMAAATAEHGWDGEWFLRAYDFYGNPVGSSRRPRGPDLHRAAGHVHHGRSRAVDPGFGRRTRLTRPRLAERALASVKERLATPHGVMLLQPAFTTYHVELGEISTYPPGYKENASVFCHTNPWVMIASAMTGDGDAAFDYYRRINPSARESIGEVHRCEPYVYAQMIAGQDAPTHGEAKNSWLTGTAAWNFVAITQWILGIRPELDGLRIDPVIPSAWPGFTATRRFRGATYEITVRRAGTLDSGTIRGCGNLGQRSPDRRHAAPAGRARATGSPWKSSSPPPSAVRSALLPPGEGRITWNASFPGRMRSPICANPSTGTRLPTS